MVFFICAKKSIFSGWKSEPHHQRPESIWQEGILKTTEHGSRPLGSLVSPVLCCYPLVQLAVQQSGSFKSESKCCSSAPLWPFYLLLVPYQIKFLFTSDGFHFGGSHFLSAATAGHLHLHLALLCILFSQDPEEFTGQLRDTRLPSSRYLVYTVASCWNAPPQVQGRSPGCF